MSELGDKIDKVFKSDALKSAIEYNISKLDDILNYQKRVYFLPSYNYLIGSLGVIFNTQVFMRVVESICTKYDDKKILYFGQNFHPYKDIPNLEALPGGISKYHTEAELVFFDVFIIKNFIVNTKSQTFKNQQMVIDYATKSGKILIFVDTADKWIKTITSTKINRKIEMVANDVISVIVPYELPKGDIDDE